MTRSRFDHSNCAHEKSKAGRAACRKALRAAAAPETAAKVTAPKPGTTTAKKAAPAAKKSPAAKPAAPAKAPAKKSPVRATAAKKTATAPAKPAPKAENA